MFGNNVVEIHYVITFLLYHFGIEFISEKSMENIRFVIKTSARKITTDVFVGCEYSALCGGILSGIHILGAGDVDPLIGSFIVDFP